MTECKEDKGSLKKITYLYTYDEVGNRTSARRKESFKSDQYVSYTYNADNQMVVATYCDGRLQTNYTYEYDANGNLTVESQKNCVTMSYQYDVENRLVAVYDKQKLLMANAYDGDGNLTTEGELYSFINSCTGRTYDLTEYVYLWQHKGVWKLEIWMS